MSDLHFRAIHSAQESLDVQVREIVRWHFDPTPARRFWLDRAKSFKFKPGEDVQGYAT